MPEITKKICLLGDFSVGKTSLIRRFVEGKFNDEYLSTIGVKISRKSLEVKMKDDLYRLNFLLWDLEGNTKFKSITPSYLKGAVGAIIVADLSRPNTLSSLSQHIDLYFKVNNQGVIIIALNKADLISPEKLTKLTQAYMLGDSNKVVATYITSAKSGDKVEEMFIQLATNIIEV